MYCGFLFMLYRNGREGGRERDRKERREGGKGRERVYG